MKMSWKNIVKDLIMLFFFILFVFVIGDVNGIMIKKVCPVDEAHKSCSFFEEYVCWATQKRHDRVKASAKRLAHCKSGCFCKKGYVRDFPGGDCIIAAGCRDHKIRAMLEKLPFNKAATFKYF